MTDTFTRADLEYQQFLRPRDKEQRERERETRGKSVIHVIIIWLARAALRARRGSIIEPTCVCNILRFAAEYVKQCSRSDPKLTACLIDALHHLRPYLSAGIPEIELPAVEPFRVSLTYRKENERNTGRIAVVT